MPVEKVIVSEVLVFSRATKGTLLFMNPDDQGVAITNLYVRKPHISDKVKKIRVTVEEVE